MIDNITIYPEGDGSWIIDINRPGGELISVRGWEEKYPTLIEQILDIANSVKNPQEQAFERVFAIVEKTATIEEVLEIADLIPSWSPWVEVEKDQLRKYSDKIYRCLTSHKTQPNWTPDLTPSLWTEIGEDEATGQEIIKWYEPTSTRNYNLGQLVEYTDGLIYESLLQNNVWSPESYPSSWKLREDLTVE